jgi:hypothetical protein
VSDGVELRRATAVDPSGIRRLTREAYAKWAPLIGRESKSMSADYEAGRARRSLGLAVAVHMSKLMPLASRLS